MAKMAKDGIAAAETKMPSPAPRQSGRPSSLLDTWVLKKTGSFYYHCDWHASHHVKAMLGQRLNSFVKGDRHDQC